MKKYDFSGWATKNDMPCADGRIIRKDAFKHQDGEEVPLVWQHKHDSPMNILGYAVLHNNEDGVRADCHFNDTEAARVAKMLVSHGDIKSLSIFANSLKEKAKNVMHGVIKEVSLVLSGANPGALIDNVVIAHGDLGTPIYDDYAAIITTGEDLEHSDEDESETIADIFDTLSDKQKEAVYVMLAQVAEEQKDDDTKKKDDDVEHSDATKNDTLQHGGGTSNNLEGSQEETHGGNHMNVFDQNGTNAGRTKAILTHSDFKNIFNLASAAGSLKKGFIQHMATMDEEVLKHAGFDPEQLKHADTYGIDNIDILFPDAVKVDSTPEFDQRRMEWVSAVLNGVRKSPFSRIKSMYADITADAARAKGYVKGNEKFEEVFPLFKRITTPTTIYKKQKLDRDDIIDITDMDVVAWIKMEMRLMLDEEVARGILVGDGRLSTSPDKINEDNLRPIYTDNPKYSIKVQLANAVTGIDEIEAIAAAMDGYKGSGATLYTTRAKMREWKFIKDGNDHYMFKDLQEVAALIGVKEIKEVEVMEGLSRTIDTVDHDLVCIIVNLKDYTVGADKGGKLAFFDDFDIDFNQYKYLYETRISGALTKIYSAVVVEKSKAVG